MDVMDRGTLARRSALGAVLAIGVALGLWSLFNGFSTLSLLRTENSIEESLWKMIGKDATFESALATMELQRYKLLSVSRTAGFLSRDRREVGSKHITAVVGSYSLGLIVTDVEAKLGFDEDNRLLDIEVRKYNDAP